MSELHAALVAAIKYWTEDPDRCDMEGREDEVAQSLMPVVAAELRRLAEETGRGADDYIANGADELKRAAAAEAKVIAGRIRARADELAGSKEVAL